MTLTLTHTKELLRKLDHIPKKHLGQNFLIDANIVQKSLDLADFKAEDTVVEVGPGLGTLSNALLTKGACVYAIEKDEVFYSYLKHTLGKNFPKTFHLVQGDAVHSPLATLPSHISEFKIIANLPYAIASPWLEAILKGPLPSHMVVMLQKEAADRFMAKCDSKDYSPITIALQAKYDAMPGHPVSKQCFYPIPKVDSYLLKLVKKQNPYSFFSKTYACMRQLFTQRRKQIGSLCRQQASLAYIFEPWLEYCQLNGIPRNTRPQAIPLEAWKKLDQYFIEHFPSS